MSTVRTSAAIAIALTLGLNALAPAAVAQASCADYARIALQQHKENVSNKCNLTGPEWNDQYSRHLQWCSSVPPAKWKAELKEREQKLSACKAR
ncbi:MAG: hypothetical protein RLZ98_1576 [Pseudomonadota bacterium]|jgi:hypothetical protein